MRAAQRQPILQQQHKERSREREREVERERESVCVCVCARNLGAGAVAGAISRHKAHELHTSPHPLRHCLAHCCTSMQRLTFWIRHGAMCRRSPATAGLQRTRTTGTLSARCPSLAAMEWWRPRRRMCCASRRATCAAQAPMPVRHGRARDGGGGGDRHTRR